MAYGTVNADLMTTSDSVSSSGLYGFKNRILNGQMVIDQRNAGASVTGGGGLVYPTDRFATFVNTDGVMTFQQVSDAPTGFKYSVKATTTTADSSLSATQRSIFIQRIEGYNIADLAWGSASASTVTLSFWVKSSLTGTFGGSLGNVSDRSYPFTYSISSANTWEYKTVIVTGETTGTWASTTSTGIQVCFGLGVGSTFSGTAWAWANSDLNSSTGATSVIGTLNATWNITGVQLEKGSTATSFDYRPYGTELQLCQRYALKYNTDGISYAYIGSGFATSTTSANISLPLPVQMRAAPSVTSSTLMVQDGTTITAVTSTAIVTNQTNSLNAYIQAGVASGLTAFRPYQLQTNASTSGYLLLSAEL